MNKFIIGAAIWMIGISAIACENVNINNVQFTKLKKTEQDLCYTSFMVRYSNTYRRPMWSAMVFDPSKNNQTKRTNTWHVEPSLKQPQPISEFPDTAIFDKGHLTPADLMASEPEMVDSFTYTNQAPQYATCNRGLWNKIEQDVKKYALRVNRPISIITGVIYPKEQQPYSIPTDYYKIVVDGNGDTKKTFVFVLPNDPDKCKTFPPILTLGEFQSQYNIRLFK